MAEIMGMPEGIPRDVLDKAECIIVFPSLLKAAFVVGVSYARGAMVCRRVRISTARGAHPQCLHWKARALDFKSAAGYRSRPVDHE